MSSSSTYDEFSYSHPKNHGYGKSKRLRRLLPSSPEYSAVTALFDKGWRHPKKLKPYVHGVFKVLSSDSDLERYLQYRKKVVSSSADLRSKLKNPANEQYLFHGTNRYCRLAEDRSRVRLCAIEECYLCSILLRSFDVSKCGFKNKFRRFGSGIYTSSCSSKADDYIANGDPMTNLRVLLVCRVIVGKPYRRRRNATKLTEPPTGYHSIVGEPGIDLNYEETVVYDNDAIRPAFLIVYGDKPPLETKNNLRSVIAGLFKTPLAV